MTAGPVFTEEMWRLACCALQDAFSATLEPVKVKLPFCCQSKCNHTVDALTFDKLLICQFTINYIGSIVEIEITSSFQFKLILNFLASMKSEEFNRSKFPVKSLQTSIH